MYKKLLLGLLLLGGCKSKKQAITRLPIREDGFYYTKNWDYAKDEYMLLKFYKNGHISEFEPNVGINELNTDAQMLRCLLDDLKDSTMSYRLKKDSIFFEKKAWGSYEFAKLSFACKVYGDSIVARIKPFDYYDTTDTKTNIKNKFFTATYKFKQALCDTVFFRQMQSMEKGR